MKFTFIKLARHRTFQHEPIYYSEQKEEQRERERRIKQELGQKTEEKEGKIEDRIRGKMRRKIRNNIDIAHSEKRKSTIRLIIILILLFSLAHYLLVSSGDWFDALMK